jgi:hypothetical protein
MTIPPFGGLTFDGPAGAEAAALAEVAELTELCVPMELHDARRSATRASVGRGRKADEVVMVAGVEVAALSAGTHRKSYGAAAAPAIRAMNP